MYDHHEDAVKIAYYFVWDTEAEVYDIIWLCDDCAAERDGGLVISGYLLPGDAKRCEDCDRPNEAAVEEYYKPSKAVNVGSRTAWAPGGPIPGVRGFKPGNPLDYIRRR
jgi:hypothetical protein